MATVGVAVAIVYGLADRCDSGTTLIAAVPAGTREALFASLAATSGALLGFAITGLTILLSLAGGERMKWLMRQKRFRMESRVLFTSTIAALGFATAVFLLLIVVATDERQFWPGWGYLALVTVTLITERIGRLVWFFHDLMGVALADAEDLPKGKAPFTEPLDD